MNAMFSAMHWSSFLVRPLSGCKQNLVLREPQRPSANQPWRWVVSSVVGALLALSTGPVLAQLKVVASFSVLADLVQEVGGEQVQVIALVGPEQDAHAYQPRPSDLARLQRADLVVVNGLGFEGWLERAVRGAAYQGPVLVASNGVSVLPGGHLHTQEHEHKPGLDAEPSQGPAHDLDHDHAHDLDHSHDQNHDHNHGHNYGQSYGNEHDHEHGIEQEHDHDGHATEQEHEHGTEGADPHAWQDPQRVRHYVQNIAQALSAQDPQHAEQYAQRAQAYLTRLDELHERMQRLLGPLASSGVRIITPHASFGYLAERYGLQFLPLQGSNVVSEARAGELARLISELKAHPNAVLFSETADVPPVLRQLSLETGLSLQGRLYSDMLSAENGPAGSYLEMMQHNAEQLAQAASHLAP